MYHKFFILQVCIVCIKYAESAKTYDLPPYINKCSRNDPKLNECMRKATEQVKPFLTKGIPELTIPPIEPYHVQEITLAQGTDSLNFKAKLTDVVIHGLSNYNFNRLDFDVPKLEWILEGQVAPVTLEGKYEVSGRILIAPIVGKGSFTAGIANCNVTAYQHAVEVTRKGKLFLQPVNTTTSIQVAGPKVKLDGLFEGDENLNRATNQVINENIDVLFEDIRPVIEKVITEIAESILNKIANNVIYDNLYPKEYPLN